ncbi:MHS family MFS transporter [Ochrobactrum haematophilum]|uniref:MHS family MFS transporter n=1 Tax=Brucella haematophila TaxID=419474 RepID=A0ABX1DVY9_9HYPH|nr:MHS family MFS transporter [Brucella haematophila]
MTIIRDHDVGHAAAVTASATPSKRTNAVIGTTIGNVLEWVDFASYAFFATIIASHFFPAGDDFLALMSTFAVFGVGFVARPLGALFFGRFGDKRGRKLALLISMPLMGIGTLFVGATPSYDSIGILAPIMLILGRVMQGFAAGGEVGNAIAFLLEWAPAKRRALYSGLQQCTSLLGTLIGSGTAALLTTIMTTEDLHSWGWRIPFLVGGLLVAPLGLYLRRHIDESPTFERAPDPSFVTDTRSQWMQGAKSLALSAGWVVSFYIYLIYLMTFVTKYSGISSQTALWANTAGLASMMISIPIFGLISDKVGRKPPLFVGLLLSLVLAYPVFSLLLGGISIAQLFAIFIGMGALTGILQVSCQLPCLKCSRPNCVRLACRSASVLQQQSLAALRLS